MQSQDWSMLRRPGGGPRRPKSLPNHTIVEILYRVLLPGSSSYCHFRFKLPEYLLLSASVIRLGKPSHDDTYHNGSDNGAQHDGPCYHQEDVFAGGTVNGHTIL